MTNEELPHKEVICCNYSRMKEYMNWSEKTILYRHKIDKEPDDVFIGNLCCYKRERKGQG